MIKYSVCIKLGLEKEAQKLIKQMKKNYKGFCSESGNENHNFSNKQVEEAFYSLGVDFKKVKGKKWFQFFKNDWTEKVYNALKELS